MTSRYPAFAPDILRLFAARGADAVDVPVIQPADPFLDMAGEDLRRRIFLTESETGQTLCLRPEFTIPVCLDHIASRADTPRRYAYLGEVFRQRREGGNEFFQAGIEDLGEATRRRGRRALGRRRVRRCSRWRCRARALAVTLGDQAVFEAVLAALGLPRGWQKRLARAFGAPELLAAALADLARPATMPRSTTAFRAGSRRRPGTLCRHRSAGDGTAGFPTERRPHAGRDRAAAAGKDRTRAACACRTTAFAALKTFLAIHVPLDRAADALAAFRQRRRAATRRCAGPVCGARRRRSPATACRSARSTTTRRSAGRSTTTPAWSSRSRRRARRGRWPAAAATTGC